MRRVRLVMTHLSGATLVQTYPYTPYCCTRHILSHSLCHCYISTVSRRCALATSICTRTYVCIQAQPPLES